VLGSMYNRVGNCNIFFIARVNTSRRSANVIGTPRPNLKFKVSRYRRAADVTARFAAISRMYQERRRNRSRVPPKLPPSRRYSPTLTRNTANLHLLSPSPLPLRPARSTSRFTFSMILPAGCNNARAHARESNCTRYADRYRTEFRFSSTGSILRNRTRGRLGKPGPQGTGENKDNELLQDVTALPRGGEPVSR